MPFVPPEAFTTRPTLEGTFGMTASTHWLATASAQAVLERGGNAFDAAVAGGFVLHLAEPHLNGPGGDLTGVFATAEEPGRPRVLMGQGPAPAGATIAHYRAEGLDLVPGAGALAAAVPGAVDAWLVLLRDHGTWELPEVLGYALGYAEQGIPLAPGAARAIAGVADLFREHWPSSTALWLADGTPPEDGSLMRNPEYAEVLRRLIRAGAGERSRQARIDAARTEWKAGFVAEQTAAFAAIPHRHSTGTVHAGVITAEDFRAFEAGYEDAVTVPFRGFTIAKTGAWGQGPALLQALRILEPLEDDRLDPSTEIGAHTILETLKLVLADRDTHYGDAQLDLGILLSAEYAATRRTLIGEDASLEFRPGLLPDVPARAGDTSTAPGSGNSGSPGSTGGGAAPAYTGPPLVTAAEWTGLGSGSAGAAGAGEPTMAGNRTGQETGRGRVDQRAGGIRTPSGSGTPGTSGASGTRDDGAADPGGAVRGDTCHIDVADQWGNMVAVTPSGGWLQSNPAIPGLGFALGTRLQMTWLDEASPSRLQPGTRPRTTLTPTLVLREGRPVAALGSPGGDQQDQWQLLLLLRLLVGGYSPQQAIDAPAFHTTAMPGSFWPRLWEPGGAVVEDRLGAEVIAGLERRGHRITRAGDWALGRLSLTWRDPGSGVLRAAANPRGAQGYAAGR